MFVLWLCLFCVYVCVYLCFMFVYVCFVCVCLCFMLFYVCLCLFYVCSFVFFLTNKSIFWFHFRKSARDAFQKCLTMVFFCVCLFMFVWFIHVCFSYTALGWIFLAKSEIFRILFETQKSNNIFNCNKWGAKLIKSRVA